MIKVTVELYPFGFNPPQRIGTLTIVNDGTGNKQTGNYKFQFLTKGKGSKVGAVTGFQRNRGFWKLIKEILIKEEMNGTKSKRTARKIRKS